MVRQGKDYVTTCLENDSETTPSVPRAVQHLCELTPYGMVLAGHGTCTAFVVNTSAEHHGLPVDTVVLTLEYQRSFKSDCEHGEEIDKYEDQIGMVVTPCSHLASVPGSTRSRRAMAQEFDDLRQEGEGRGDTICHTQVDGILPCTCSVRNLPLQDSEVQAPFTYVITDGLKSSAVGY